MEAPFDRIVGIITQRDKLKVERDDLASQLGEITAAVNAWEHLPIDPSLGLVDSIKAADAAFLRNCEEADAAMEFTCGELLTARKAAAQARQETLREVAKAMGAEEAFEAMVSLVGAEKTTPECFAEMLRMCAASSPEEVALQFKAAKIEHPGILFTITEGDPFTGIMDGPEMMPTWDEPSDLGDVKMSAHCEGEGDQ